MAEGEPVIRELFAWIGTYGDGSEGIIAGGIEGIGMAPLITSRRRTADQMRRYAERGVAETPGCVSVRLVRFVIEEVRH
jgi:hypothetical protein